MRDSQRPTSQHGDQDQKGSVHKEMFAYGETAFFTCRYDSRFSYCMYVPHQLYDRPESGAEMVVLVHGTQRNVEGMRASFASFGKWHNCIMLVPLFPIGVCGDDYRDGYKDITEKDIRYDQVLLHMVEEAAARYQQSIDKFALYGYSGGGQFVNRFLFLYPEKLWAASIGAPGRVTLVDQHRDWWVGIRNTEELFGRQVNVDALRKVPVQLLVGSLDTETWEIHVDRDDEHWMEGANDAGATRIERLWTLKNSLESAGVGVAFEMLPGAAHDATKAVDAVGGFLARQLAVWRSTRDGV